MASADPRVDAYIAKAPAFAQPILKHLRKLIHEACPAVQETIKWGVPFFDYKGALCSMASFKAHCGFGLWKEKLIPDPKGYIKTGAEGAAGSFGKITTLKELPPDKVLLQFIKAACKLNDDGVKAAPPVKKKAEAPVETPEDLLQALKKNKKAAAAFEAFPPSHRKEYIRWIIEAKAEAARNRRIETAIEWIAEGKGRNWKYQKQA
jgi:uncharacterized protein YdeI (YjbR/CyaY-like superfamily)